MDNEEWIASTFIERVRWEQDESQKCTDENEIIHITVYKCSSSPECIVVVTAHVIPLLPCQGRDESDWQAFNLATSEAWYLSLDPSSYAQASDGESYGTYWCCRPSYRNEQYYYRPNRAFAALGPRDREHCRKKNKACEPSEGPESESSKTPENERKAPENESSKVSESEPNGVPKIKSELREVEEDKPSEVLESELSELPEINTNKVLESEPGEVEEDKPGEMLDTCSKTETVTKEKQKVGKRRSIWKWLKGMIKR